MRTKKALVNVFMSLLLQILIVLYGFIIPKIIISNFGSEINGLITSITQFLGYIALLESGFGPVVKAALFKPIAKNDVNTIKKILKSSERFFRKIALIFLIYILLLIIFYPLVFSKEFNFIFTSSLIFIISISTFAEYFFGMTYKLYLNSKQENYIVSAIQMITYIISLILIIITVKVYPSIHVIKLVSCLVFVLRPIFQNMYVKRKYQINLNDVDSSYEISQKWDGLAQHIASVIHTNTDVTILTFFSTLVNVSIYSVYYMVTKGIRSLIQSLTMGIDATFGDIIVNNEQKNLNKKFGIYEVFYNIIITIVFTCTIILIVPFVSVYTKNVTDANYIQYTFGILLVISEYVWAIRQPYNMLIKSAGHFKETRVGAWIECISNIIISIVLVKKFGLIGVSIGTIVAMTIRTIEFIFHANRKILYRPVTESVKKIIPIIVETLIIILVCECLPFVDNIDYLHWILNAFMTVTVSALVTLLFNLIFFKDELKETVTIVKKVIKRGDAHEKGI